MPKQVMRESDSVRPSKPVERTTDPEVLEVLREILAELKWMHRDDPRKEVAR